MDMLASVRLVSLRRTCLVVLAATIALAPPAAEGQAVHLRVGYSVSGLTTSTWTPTYGPSVGLEVSAWGGVGFGVEYSRTSRYRGEISGYCGFEFCFDGPFDEDVFLRSVGIDVSKRVLRTGVLDLRAGLRARFFTQGRHMADIRTGEEFDRGVVTDAGLGARVEVRPHADVAGFIPTTWLIYDRIFATGCPSDGTCYGTRRHLEVGLGFLIGG